jgi:hypothetical protein
MRSRASGSAQRLHLACELGRDGEQSEPVGLFLSAGAAVRGVAAPVDFCDEIVQVRESHEASAP